MKTILGFLSTCCFLAICVDYGTALNGRPIIGVLTQGYVGKFRPRGTGYIAASYVKYLESAGARVVPVLVNQTREYYVNIFNWTNGLLLPGGGEPYYDPDSGLGKAGKIIFDLATKANDRNDFYPIWGTCLGFQFLNYLAANNTLWQTKCSAKDMASPLDITQEATDSRIYRSFSAEVKNYLTTLPVTVYYHQWCLTPQNYTRSGLDRYFRVVSLHRDRNNLQYIATIEALNYPFYGTAYHPEKNQFEFVYKNGSRNIPHSYEAIRVAQEFANFFVNQARASKHSFPDAQTEAEYLIYNYAPENTGIKNSSFQQLYFFPIDVED